MLNYMNLIRSARVQFTIQKMLDIQIKSTCHVATLREKIKMNLWWKMIDDSFNH